MQVPSLLRTLVFSVFIGPSLMVAAGQTRSSQPSAACPTAPSTLRAMRDCYRALLVFAPSINDPKMMEQFNQLKAHPADIKSRDLIYVPIVPEGHNQPIPGSKIHTASLSEDELAAVRHHYEVQAADFLVILLGKDGGEKLNSRTPVTFDKLKALIDSMPMRKSEMSRAGEQ